MRENIKAPVIDFSAFGQREYHWPEPLDFPLQGFDETGAQVLFRDPRVPCSNGCGIAKYHHTFKRTGIIVKLYFCDRCDHFTAVRERYDSGLR